MQATVISETLNYRSQPKLGDNVLGHFEKGQTVEMMGSAPSAPRWAIIHHGGQTVYSARRYLAQQMNGDFPALDASIETLISDIVWDTTRKYDSIRYRLGCKCSRRGLKELVFSGTDIAGAACSGTTVDCSGWMHGLFQLIAVNINEALNRTVFPSMTVGKLSNHSDGQVAGIGTITNQIVSGTDIDKLELRSAMRFGINFADYDWEGQERVFEIDHIVMGVQRPNGYYIVQSSSGGGAVNTVPWQTWRQNTASKFEAYRVHAVHLMGAGNWQAQPRGDTDAAEGRSLVVDPAPFSAPPG